VTPLGGHSRSIEGVWIEQWKQGSSMEGMRCAGGAVDGGQDVGRIEGR
jgi:hypothetical protein